MEYNEYKFLQKKVNLKTDLVMIFHLLQDGCITVCCTMAPASRGPSDLTGASWSRAGLAMVPFFSGSILPKPLDLDAIFLYLVVEELNSSKPNQLQKGVASHVSPSVQLIQTLLWHGWFVRENQRPLGAFPDGSCYETCIQSALQHFQHCFLIPLAWIEFGCEFCRVGLIWIDCSSTNQVIA